MRIFCSLLLLLSSATQAQAANVLNFTTSTATGNGSVTPVVTWSTVPVAASCTASGGWSGAKAPAGGTETLPATTVSKTLTLACAWNDGFATVTWVAPTQRTDGTAYTNPSLSRIFYGTTQAAMTTTSDVPAPATTKTISPLASGTWYFKVQAVDTAGGVSADSNVASKVVPLGSQTQQISITVNPVPMPPTAVTVQ